MKISYTNRNQVSSITVDGPPPVVTYGSDLNCNRVTVSGAAGAGSYTPNALNQYTAIGSLPALAYNGNGNLVSSNGWTYTYDAQNRLIRASGPSTTAAFAYDARNRCVSRTINGITTYYTYDVWNLIEDRSASDAQLAYYIQGATIDEPLSIVVSNVAHFYHHDALGSTVRITDGSGQVEESYTYDVFGAVAIKDGTGNPLTTSAIGNRFMFTGREWLKEVGLYDYRNRAYSQDLGRFLQTDPIRFDAGDVNLYRYVGNNPLNSVDPNGTLNVVSVIRCMIVVAHYNQLLQFIAEASQICYNNCLFPTVAQRAECMTNYLRERAVAIQRMNEAMIEAGCGSCALPLGPQPGVNPVWPK